MKRIGGKLIDGGGDGISGVKPCEFYINPTIK
jgi:hypothetical protein